MDSYDRFKAVVEDVIEEMGFCKPSEVGKRLGCSRQRVHQLMQHGRFSADYDYFNKRAIVHRGVSPDPVAIANVGVNADRKRFRIDGLKQTIQTFQFPDYTVTFKWLLDQMPKGLVVYKPELSTAIRELTDEGILLMPHGHNILGHITTPESWNDRLNGNGPVKSQTDIVRKFLGAYRRTGDTFYPHQVTMATGVNPGIVYNMITTLLKVGEIECLGQERGLGQPRVLYRFIHPTAAE